MGPSFSGVSLCYESSSETECRYLACPSKPAVFNGKWQLHMAKFRKMFLTIRLDLDFHRDYWRNGRLRLEAQRIVECLLDTFHVREKVQRTFQVVEYRPEWSWRNLHEVYVLGVASLWRKIQLV